MAFGHPCKRPFPTNGGKHDPHDLATEAAVLQDFLADQLTLAIAVRGKPDTACGAEGDLDGLQLARLVSTDAGLVPKSPSGRRRTGVQHFQSGFTSSGSSSVIRCPSAGRITP